MRWNHNGGVLSMACSLFRDIGVRDERVQESRRVAFEASHTQHRSRVSPQKSPVRVKILDHMVSSYGV